jgi:uncharacterized membrane protein
MEQDAIAAVRAAFTIGAERSPAQDLEYSIRQLVEIALRALSPGINDTFTAIAVIDRLGDAMELVLCRSLEPSVLRDEEGMIRVIAEQSEIGGLFDASFDQIRQAGAEKPAILIQLADTLGKLAPVLRQGPSRHAVLVHLDRLAETAGRAVLVSDDRETTLARIQRARAAAY